MKQEDTDGPFFVVGIGRSGTTLLRLMLNAHPRLAIPYETDFLDKYAQAYGGRVLSEEKADPVIRELLSEPMLQEWDFQVDQSKLTSHLARQSDITIAELLNSIYLQYAHCHGKQRWGDKSSYVDSLPDVLKMFPSAKVIHIIRDGRDVANSVMKLDWGPSDVIAASQWWAEHVRLLRRMGAVMGASRYHEVRFEDLLGSPEEELISITDFLGETYYESMLNYHQSAQDAIPDSKRALHFNTDQPIKKGRAYAWKSTMRAADVAIFQKYAGRMLDEMRYPKPDDSPARAFVACRILSLLSRRLLA